MSGVGYRDIEKKLCPDGDTRFPIGSVSKSFLTAAVSMAEHEGKMDLDAPLARYLPGFAPAGDPRVGRATIRQVLQHESGLGNPQILVCGPRAALLQPDHIFVDLMNQISTSNKHGDRYGKWTYSNAGYGLVALALENVYPGRQYFDFLNDRILQPLHLGRTGDAHSIERYKKSSSPSCCGVGSPGKDSKKGNANIAISERTKLREPLGTDTDPNTAYSYGRMEDGTYQKLKECTVDKHSTSSLAPFGLHSSVNDLLKWAIAIIASKPQEPLVNLDHILRDTYEWNEHPENQSFYNMGWARVMTPTTRLGASSYNCVPCPALDLPPRCPIMHANGIMNGATCAVYTFPQTQTVVVACANSTSDGDGADWTAKILIQALFGSQGLPTDPSIDFLALATAEAKTRREKYYNMLLEWKEGRDANLQVGHTNDFVGLYKGSGMTMLISSASFGTGETSNEQMVKIHGSATEDELQLIFNGVEDSIQNLVPYSTDVWSFFPRTRDEWIANSMIDWDFVGAGLLRFVREDNIVVSVQWEWDENENAVVLWKERT